MSEPRTPLLVDLSVSQFSAALASGDAAPGGGSAAALAGALAAGLATMVARLTIGREQYRESQETMVQLETQAERLRGQLLALVDADAGAYGNVMAAYKMPKDHAHDRSVRTEAIQAALKHAAELPLAAAEACVQVLHLSALAAQYGNKNAASDAGVAGLLAYAALQSAVRNVRVNLAGINDVEFRAIAEARLAGLVAKADASLRRVSEE